MLKVISFDVDGTLVHPSFAEDVWLKGIPQLYAQRHNTDGETAQAIVKKEYDRIGENDIRWYQLDYWFNLFDLEGEPAHLLAQYTDSIQIYQEVPEVLDRLSTKYMLIVASNAHRDFLSLSLSSIDFYFDYIFSATSDFKKVRKHQDFYQRICTQIQVTPGEIAHVGDHRKFDYEVPRQLGIHSFFLDRTGRDGLKSLREFERKVQQLERILS